MAPKPHDARGGGPAHDYVTLGELLDFVHRWRLTIGVTLLTITGLVALRLVSRPPAYEASATLLLEQAKESGGLLSDLALLTSAPAAEKEMAILRLRSLAEQVVRDPDEWAPRTAVFEPVPADDPVAARAPHLGLTTRATAEDLSPYRALVRRLRGDEHGPHRLFASFEAGSPESSEALRVSFPARDRVRIAVPGFLGLGERDTVELAYEPGGVFEHGPARLRLAATGDYVGKSYRVERVGFEAAVEDLMSRVDVRETSRNSGVLVLGVEDIDPNRAADVANAIVAGYIARNVQIRSRRATKMMSFLESELERVTALLHEAEQAVVEISARHPQGINVEASSQAAIEQISAYEAEKVGLRLALEALQEARALLLAGKYEALARLSSDLPDRLTLGYVDAIGALSGDALQLERSDAGRYKHLLQEKVADLHQARERSLLVRANLRDVLAGIESGDEDALARLAGVSDSGLDAVSEKYVAEIARLDTELAGLSQVVTRQHPEYVAKEAARAALLELTAAHVSSRIQGIEALAEDQAVIAEAWQRRIDDWPEAEHEQITAAIDELVARISDNIASQIDWIGGRLSGLDETTRLLEEKLASLPEAQRMLAESTRQRETYAAISRVLMESLQQAQLNRAATLSAAVLVDPALPPSRPAGPPIFSTLLLSALLSFLVGAGLAWIRSGLADNVRTQAQLEEITALPVVGTVPDFRRGHLRRKGQEAGFAHVRDAPEGPVAEVYRSIRESLRFAVDPGLELRTLAVVSSVPDEGKTITNVNLALSLASPESRVLLVDADLRKPSVADFFALDAGPGFDDVLQGASWREAVQPSKYAGLDVLPAFKAKSSAGDSLRGARVRALVEELAKEYDRVVFDLPPLVGMADVETFADQLDGVVLLVRAETVPRRIVAAAIGRLRRSGVRTVGTILNAVRPQRRGQAYYYRYYGSEAVPPGRSRGAA